MAASKKPTPAATKPPARRKASGPPQPEAERTNKLFALRLSPELRAALEARAQVWGIGLGPAMVRLLEAGLEASKR